eukprot:NODE_1949_length_700_cov_272.341014_g1519_i0.p1 GENE.NODE_1949_length_700_cov_272.341014_g1519_i0~~NODE_1949_length_700_cov_272.341014_g1519_i0.p1  ORF type:complete len:121 (-),score=18.36 NODE_1949_length_700_cov_272.341014_g1519_i0:145-507(-)
MMRSFFALGATPARTNKAGSVSAADCTGADRISAVSFGTRAVVWRSHHTSPVTSSDGSACAEDVFFDARSTGGRSTATIMEAMEDEYLAGRRRRRLRQLVKAGAVLGLGVLMLVRRRRQS